MIKVKLEQQEGGLRVLTLADPDRRNVIDQQMRDELLSAVQTIAADPEATAVVIAGEGSAFCAGADLPAIFGDTSRSVATIREDLREVYACFLAVRSLAIPTIAAVQGAAVGAGLNLAMVCDIRVAGPRAKFAATFSQIGLHPGGGCTWFLVQALGPERALKLLLDGGTVVGDETVRLGLAGVYADDPLATALELGRRYADLDGRLSRDIKRAVAIAARDGLEATIDFEAWAQASSATGPAIQDFVAKFAK
jgi:enoyl-CoA hydratase